MTDDSRIRQLLEEVLESGRAPEEVTRDCPELLAGLVERLCRTRAVEAELDAMFPTPPLVPRPSGGGTELPRLPGYQVESVLGRGGMGVVYRARHIELDRPVAIKMLLSGMYAGPPERKRFSREAQLVARLQHPNVVQVYDVGEHEGRPYYTMELVEGRTLAAELDGRPRPARQAASLLVTLAYAVDAANALGIIHRDLKPANILLTADGTPKVADFGLARREEAEAGLTLSGARLGTPSYMAPEQARGHAREVGPKVDVYALGAILYESLTGRPPFRGESTAETERQVLFEEPVPPSRLNANTPRDLETICLKALRKDPIQRFETAGELACDLERFLKGEPITARPVGLLERLTRWIRRNPTGTALICAVVVLAALGLSIAGRELSLAAREAAEAEKLEERLAFVKTMQAEGRYDEARAILARLPDGGLPELRRRIRQTQDELGVLERMEQVRLSRGRFLPGGGIDYAECSRQYEEAFRECGLGEFQQSPAMVADRIRRLGIRAPLVGALDDWAACATAEPRAWILDVARRVDPHPLRDRIRDQERWARLDVLAELGASLRVEEHPVKLLVAMGTRWRRLGGDPTEFLKRVQRRYPSDFWVNFELGHLLGAQEPRVAIGFNRAAVAVRPRAAVAHYNLANGLLQIGDSAGAIHHLSRAVEEDPSHAWAHRQLAECLIQADRADAAIAHLRLARELDPADAWALLTLNRTLIESDRAAEAQDHWRSVLANGTGVHEAWDGYAELCLFRGDVAEYRRARTELLARFESSTDPHVCERVARACMLAPSSPPELRDAVAMIDRALGADPSTYSSWAYPYFLFAKGLGEFRQGLFEESIRTLRRCGADVLSPAPRLVLAMALQGVGRNADARRVLGAAIVECDWRVRTAVSRELWMYHVLRREAARMILPEVRAFLAGTHQPRENDERFALIGVCESRGNVSALAELQADAIATDPSLFGAYPSQRGFHAARHLASAGCAPGTRARDLTDEQRTRYRALARDWLRADVAIISRLLDEDALAQSGHAVETLSMWQREIDLAGLRDATAIATLPGPEQDECRAIWKAVDGLLVRLRNVLAGR